MTHSNALPQSDAIIIGELNVDLILDGIQKAPQIGKEVLARSSRLTLGSSSAILANNLSALGTSTAFVGKLGCDAFGDLCIKTLSDRKVDTSWIIRQPGLQTGVTVVMSYLEDRANVTCMGAMADLTIQDIPETVFKNARHMHLSACFMQPGLKKDLVQLFRTAKANGLTTSFDPQWDPEESWDLDLNALLTHVDFFLPNETEFLYLTRKTDLDAAFQSVSECGSTLVVKQGSNGSTRFSHNTKVHVPACLNKNVVDTVGAGDSFNAGFIHSLLNGNTIDRCHQFASLTGAINTTCAGGTGAFSSFESIQRIAFERFNFSI